MAILVIWSTTSPEETLSHDGADLRYGFDEREIPFPLLCMRPMVTAKATEPRCQRPELNQGLHGAATNQTPSQLTKPHRNYREHARTAFHCIWQNQRLHQAPSHVPTALSCGLMRCTFHIPVCPLRFPAALFPMQQYIAAAPRQERKSGHSIWRFHTLDASSTWSIPPSQPRAHVARISSLPPARADREPPPRTQNRFHSTSMDASPHSTAPAPQLRPPTSRRPRLTWLVSDSTSARAFLARGLSFFARPGQGLLVEIFSQLDNFNVKW